MNTPISDALYELYQSLLLSFGHRSWWPGDTPYEIAAGAILTQNTNWVNVEKAIANLKKSGALDPYVLQSMPIDQLALLIRPAGYYNQKAKRLKSLTEWFLKRCSGEEPDCITIDTAKLRQELLSINGIGPETADSILLYAFNRPQFVVDSYTHRILTRLGFAGNDKTYHHLQSLFMDNLPHETPLYNDYHAQLVELGKRFCRKKPKCEKCPVRAKCAYFEKNPRQE